MTKLVAPEGTCTENRCALPAAPDNPVRSSNVTVLPPPVLLVLKAAPTLAELVPAATVQVPVPVPVQAPLQPAKLLPLLGMAVNTTLVVLEKLTKALLQLAAQ